MAMWYSYTFEECGLADYIQYLLYPVLSNGLRLAMSVVCVCLWSVVSLARFVLQNFQRSRGKLKKDRWAGPFG